jgi:hypothetical protein
LFECLTSEFGFFLDFNFIPRQDHREDDYGLDFEESERNLNQYFAALAKSVRAPSPDASPWTYKEFMMTEKMSTGPNVPELNGMNASLGHSSRNLSGRNVWGSFQYLAIRLR